MSGFYERPEWAVLGVQTKDGVLVIASNTLSQVELEQEMPDLLFSTWADPWNQPQTFLITASMRSITMVIGENYIDALRKLFANWNPDESPAEQRALPSSKNPLP